MKTLINSFSKILTALALSFFIIFVSSVIVGAQSNLVSNELISVTEKGNVPNNAPNFFDISKDGSVVVYDSAATDIFESDVNNSRDIFAYDRAEKTTKIVSVDSEGEQSNGNHSSARISESGRYVVFSSNATDLVEGSGSKLNVYRHDLYGGDTILISKGLNSEPANGTSGNSDINSDGNIIVYTSRASNIVSNDNNTYYDVFMYNVIEGTTTLVSMSNSGIQANSNTISRPSISNDGRYIAFASSASNLIDGKNDVNGYQKDAFLFDNKYQDLRLLNVDSQGDQNVEAVSYVSVSGDGKYVAFNSFKNDLVEPSIASLVGYIYTVEDGTLQAPIRSKSGDIITAGINGISEDGQYLSFGTGEKTWQEVGDANDQYDIYRLNTITKEVDIIALRLDGSQTNTKPYGYVMSSDGQSVVYGSLDRLLVGLNEPSSYKIGLVRNFMKTCEGFTPTISGTTGDDELVGTSRVDVIMGFGGDDTIRGLKGNDVICGGDGNDVVYGNKGSDTIFGEAGDDLILGGRGADELDGGDGDDVIKGAAGEDIIMGGNDNDILKGGKHNDAINGGNGNDFIEGGKGNDTITDDDGNDIVFGQKGDDNLDGGNGKNFIFGGRGADTCVNGKLYQCEI